MIVVIKSNFLVSLFCVVGLIYQLVLWGSQKNLKRLEEKHFHGRKSIQSVVILKTEKNKCKTVKTEKEREEKTSRKRQCRDHRSQTY